MEKNQVNMTRILRKLAVFCSMPFILCSSNLAIENSIITELGVEQCIKQHRSKFSDEQYKEILSALEAPCKFRIMTYNVLSKCYDDIQKNENRWENRKLRITKLIRSNSPDILCCQELTTDQIQDMLQELSPEYDVVAPLPSEQNLSELLGIFYKKQRFKLQQSEKKELGKMYYWEELKNYCFQYFIKAKFLDKNSGKEFVVYNTHADYLKPNVRLQLVKLLLEDAEKNAQSYPTILAGDFNTVQAILPNPYTHPLTPVFDASYLLQTITKKNFRNALDLTLIAHAGPMSSFTCYHNKLEPFVGVDSFGFLMDHIFVTPKDIKVIFHAIEPATIDGYFPSDHVPVIADLSIL